MVKQKLIRITTVARSLDGSLKKQLSFFNQYFDVIALSSGRDILQKIEKEEGFRTINVDMQREISVLNDLKSLFNLIRIFRKEKPFIVHSHTPKGSLLAMIAAWVTRVPNRIYTVTGLRFETTKGKMRFLLVTMEKISCWCATLVIPEGDGVKKTLIENKITRKSLNKVLNGNINGVDLNHYHLTPDVIQQANEIRSKCHGFTFCFVGRIVKDKGINELIQAFYRLYEEKYDISLVLVGGFEKKLDPILPQNEKLMYNHPRIHFLGFQQDVRPFYSLSDALVFPSYREGFPNVVLQAGAMGLPSIVTDINGSNEIIIDGINGRIIPAQNEEALYEMMKFFIENKNGMVKKMANNARSMIEQRFEQKKVWTAMLNKYQSL